MEIVQVIFYSTFVSLSRDATPNTAKAGGRSIESEWNGTSAVPSMIKREVKRESPSSSPSLCDLAMLFLSLSLSLCFFDLHN